MKLVQKLKTCFWIVFFETECKKKRKKKKKEIMTFC